MPAAKRTGLRKVYEDTTNTVCKEMKEINKSLDKMSKNLDAYYDYVNKVMDRQDEQKDGGHSFSTTDSKLLKYTNDANGEIPTIDESVKRIKEAVGCR